MALRSRLLFELLQRRRRLRFQIGLETLTVGISKGRYTTVYKLCMRQVRFNTPSYYVRDISQTLWLAPGHWAAAAAAAAVR